MLFKFKPSITISFLCTYRTVFARFCNSCFPEWHKLYFDGHLEVGLWGDVVESKKGTISKLCRRCGWFWWFYNILVRIRHWAVSADWLYMLLGTLAHQFLVLVFGLSENRLFFGVRWVEIGSASYSFEGEHLFLGDMEDSPNLGCVKLNLLSFR